MKKIHPGNWAALGLYPVFIVIVGSRLGWRAGVMSFLIAGFFALLASILVNPGVPWRPVKGAIAGFLVMLVWFVLVRMGIFPW